MYSNLYPELIVANSHQIVARAARAREAEDVRAAGSRRTTRLLSRAGAATAGACRAAGAMMIAGWASTYPSL